MRGLLLLVFLFSLTVRAEESVRPTEKSNSVVTESMTTSSVTESQTLNAESTAAAGSVTTPTPSPTTTVRADNRQESEISLNLDNTKKQTDNDHPLFRFLAGVIIFAMLAMGGFIYLRRQGKISPLKSQTQIKVISQHYLGPKKSLAIVRVAGESMLIGITDHNISMMKSLSLLDEDIPEETPQNFSNVLGRFTAKDRDFKVESKKRDELEPEEEFAIKGIKDVVTKRLKNMRSLE